MRALLIMSVHLELRLLSKREREPVVQGGRSRASRTESNFECKSQHVSPGRHVSLRDSFGSGCDIGANQEGSDSPVVGPLQPLRSAVTGNVILAELVAHNERRNGGLLEYTAVKSHQMIDSRGEMYAEEIEHIEYHAPDKKTL